MFKKSKEIKELKELLKQAQKVIQIQKEENLRALKINIEHQKLNGSLQTKITDLENNIAFLVDNLSANKRKQLGL